MVQSIPDISPNDVKILTPRRLQKTAAVAQERALPLEIREICGRPATRRRFRVFTRHQNFNARSGTDGTVFYALHWVSLKI